MFNYIVNIHNSGNHLDRVLTALFACKDMDSKVYAVLDGCTDNSKEVAQRYPLTIIETPDVRETKAITTALNTIPQEGYNFILQDDVFLQDLDLEEHIKEVYELIPNIGVLSFRHGANFGDLTGVYSSEKDVIQSEFQPICNAPLLKEGFITERQIVYKSPICISSEVVNQLGGYDPYFEPIAHDDTEYCVRAHIHGFRNFVCALNVDQPLELGGCRRFSDDFNKINLQAHKDHFTLLKQFYKDELTYLSNNSPSLEEIQVWKTY